MVSICLESILRWVAQSHLKWLFLIWVRSTGITRTLKDYTSHSLGKGDHWGWGMGSGLQEGSRLSRELQTHQLGGPEKQVGGSPPKPHSPTRLWAVKTNSILFARGLRFLLSYPTWLKLDLTKRPETVSMRSKIPIARVTQISNPNPVMQLWPMQQKSSECLLCAFMCYLRSWGVAEEKWEKILPSWSLSSSGPVGGEDRRQIRNN